MQDFSPLEMGLHDIFLKSPIPPLESQWLASCQQSPIFEPLAVITAIRYRLLSSKGPVVTDEIWEMRAKALGKEGETVPFG